MISENLTSNESASTLAETSAPDYMGTATYCPEDNKLRLYVGRVLRSDYERLRADGWTSTPKQSCDFVATWTPDRRDLCMEWCGSIEDEDQTPEDRAADRAERFGGYLDKRLSEATGHADRYEAGPMAHGYQSEKRAERAAARHDRVAGYACDAWSKAEYWQRRTAGVISHALYKSTPAVRMGRIKELEAEIRKAEKSRTDYQQTRERWLICEAMTDPEKQNAMAAKLAYIEHGDYIHPRTGKKTYLYDLIRPDDERNPDPLTGAEACALFLAKHRPLSGEGEWLTHYRLRLAYENQMLEAQGGRAAFVEMEVGGWIGNFQIRKVNKSNATGRVVSVTVKVKGQKWGRSDEGFHFDTITVERLPANAYRPPSDEDRAALADTKKSEKANAPKKDPCPLVNPTDDDAQRLQEAINEREKANYRGYGEFKPAQVTRITQAIYSANSKGSYARAETRGLSRNMELADRDSNMWTREREERRKRIGPAVCQVRITGYAPESVIILTDKPQKPLPAAVWSLPKEAAPDFALEAETVNA